MWQRGRRSPVHDLISQPDSRDVHKRYLLQRRRYEYAHTRERLLHVISFTNNYLNETHGDASMFSTIFMGIINPQENMLSYINCGNESPLLLRNGRVMTALKPTGPVVGVIPDAKFAVKEILMENNDLLLAYTDGIPDALNVKDESFGNARLIAAVDGCDTDPAALLNHIQTQLAQFIGTARTV